jgi:Uma2 family endonuclease
MSTVEGLPVSNSLQAVLDAMEAAEPGSRAEHIGGAFTLDRPTPIHQATAFELAVALRSVIPDGHRVIAEVRVSDGDAWITPDILVVPESIALSDASPIDPQVVLLMCEVLSASTGAKDRTEKRKFAERHGIDYWLVATGDPWGTIETMPYGGGQIRVPTTN